MGPCNRVPRPGAAALSSTAGGSLTPHPCVETSDISQAVGALEPSCSSFLVSRLAGTGSFVWFLLAQLNQKGPPSPELLGSPTLPHSTERVPQAATHTSQGAGHVSRPGGVFRLTRPRKAPEKQLLSAAPGWWAQVGPAAALPATVHIQPHPPASDLDYTHCGRDPQTAWV